MCNAWAPLSQSKAYSGAFGVRLLLDAKWRLRDGGRSEGSSSADDTSGEETST